MTFLSSYKLRLKTENAKLYAGNKIRRSQHAAALAQIHESGFASAQYFFYRCFTKKTISNDHQPGFLSMAATEQTILFVDDTKAMREQFAYDIRRKTGHKVLTAANGREALQILVGQVIDAVILDLEMPVMDGLTTLEKMVEKNMANIPVIVYTGRGNFQSCVRAVQLGAYNFFDKNETTLDQLVRALENALAHRRLLDKKSEKKKGAQQDSPLIGESAAMVALKAHLARVAEAPSNVLIHGESGTGKELIAHEIHRLSPRSKGPFVAVNCAAIPENLVESELFGFEKGAFSGAGKTTKGKFELASGGTLFLDEIGDMPLSVQAKLLRVLQEGEITRIGGEARVIRIDVRVVSATHRDLERAAEQDEFRMDLFYRIATHIVKAPPLRERISDVEELSLFLIQRICKRFKTPRKIIHPATLALLKNYNWRKNNVRELENVLERALVATNGDEILPENLPDEIGGRENLNSSGEQKSFQELRRTAERDILLQHLEANHWHITNTAKALGIANHSNLLKMMRRLGIQKPGA